MIRSLVPYNTNVDLEDLEVLNTSSYPLLPGDNRTLELFNEVSKNVLRNPRLRGIPAFTALGFWLRSGNLKNILKENSLDVLSQKFHLTPCGLVFHLCPSNVDTMFFYSFTLSLLGGNKNIIRISDRIQNPEVLEFFEILDDILSRESYRIFKNYISVISYPRNDELNNKLSRVVDARIIWGGDATINQFKSYQTKPRVKDLYFSDKVSISVLNVEDGNFENNIPEIAKSLANDIYTFDQMGCSSPHCLFFVGENSLNQTKIESLYNQLIQEGKKRYSPEMTSMASIKFNRATIDLMEGVTSAVVNSNNLLLLNKLEASSIPKSCGFGYLYFQEIDAIKELIPYLSDTCQTIGYWGLGESEIRTLQNHSAPNSVFRIVPIGKSLEFDHVWDGYNIFLELINFKRSL